LQRKGLLDALLLFSFLDHDEGRMKRLSLAWFMEITAMLGLFSSCALFSHKPTAHISVKAVSWELVKIIR